MLIVASSFSKDVGRPHEHRHVISSGGILPGIGCSQCSCHDSGHLISTDFNEKLAYSILRAVKNVFWNPLSQFPGPYTFAASSLPYALTSMNGILHRNYAPVISLLAFAGTETVATLLPALTYLLIQNPRAMQELVLDLRSNFPKVESMTTERLSKMEYLTVCIKEGLRLFPPTPEGLPRVAPPKGAMISGHWVPGNVSTSSKFHEMIPFN